MNRLVSVCIMVVLVALPAVAKEASSVASGNWLALADEFGAVSAAADPAATPASKGPPLPLHCIEGVSGGVITPMAYLANKGPAGATFGRPVAAYTFMTIGEKNLHVFTVTQTFFERIELGYAFHSFSLGSLPHDLKRRGLDNGPDSVQMHVFNARVNLIPEGSFGLPLPAITAGAHFKYNEGIRNINKSLNNTLDTIGYDSHYGTDFTLTASKTFANLCFGRPVIASVGLRNSRASQTGYLGFGDTCNTTIEANIACLATDWLVLAYEFRQKNSPYDRLAKLIDKEDAWHAWSATWVVNENLTISGVYGMLGNVANARSDCSFAVQAKYEF